MQIPSKLDTFSSGQFILSPLSSIDKDDKLS